MAYTLEFVTSAPYLAEYFNYCAVHKSFPSASMQLQEKSDEVEAECMDKGWLHGLLWRSAASCEVDVNNPNKFRFTTENIPPVKPLSEMTIGEQTKSFESIFIHGENITCYIANGQITNNRVSLDAC